MKAFSSSLLTRLFPVLRDERGAAFVAQLLISSLISVIAATGLVRAVWEAHESSMREYRRLRVLEELQAEMEYWKAQIFVKDVNYPRPTARNTVVIERGKRSLANAIVGTYEPAPSIRLYNQVGLNAYEITVSLSWFEGGVEHQETLRTAINPVR